MFARCATALATTLFVVTSTVAADADADRRTREIVNAAISSAGRSIPAQANALAHLAWPEVDGDLEVQNAARLRLINYHENAISTLRKAIGWVRPDQQDAVVHAMMRAWMKIGHGLPPDFLPGLSDAVWYGTREARLRAIPQLGRFRYTPAMLTIIDAAYEDPALVEVSIDALGAMGDTRARFFLERMMIEGPTEIRGLAASGLARLGDHALLPLKIAIRSDDPELRVLAAQALLPVATVDDLSTLHEYVYNHPDDDPATVDSVRASAIALEELLARQISADAASE